MVSDHIPAVGKMVLFAQLHPRISINAIAFFSNRIKIGCICAVLFIRRFILSNDLSRLLDGFRLLDGIIRFVVNNRVVYFSVHLVHIFVYGLAICLTDNE